MSYSLNKKSAVWSFDHVLFQNKCIGIFICKYLTQKRHLSLEPTTTKIKYVCIVAGKLAHFSKLNIVLIINYKWVKLVNETIPNEFHGLKSICFDLNFYISNAERFDGWFARLFHRQFRWCKKFEYRSNPCGVLQASNTSFFIKLGLAFDSNWGLVRHPGSSSLITTTDWASLA